MAVVPSTAGSPLRGAWDHYVQNEASCVLQRLRCAILLSLCAPKTASETDHADIFKKLGNHFSPRPLKIVKRFEFHKRTTAYDEPMAAFIADLRRIAVTCNFGDTIDSSSRDQIVCGVKNETLQRRLLSEVVLTLTQAEKLAIAAKSANNAVETRTIRPRTSA